MLTRPQAACFQPWLPASLGKPHRRCPTETVQLLLPLLLLLDHLLHLALLLLGLGPNTKRFREVPPLNLITKTAFSS